MSTLPLARDEQACDSILAQVARDVRSPGLAVVEELRGRLSALVAGLEMQVRRQDLEEDIRARLSAQLRSDGCGGERWSIGVHVYVDECDEGCLHGATVASAVGWLADSYDLSTDVAQRLVAEAVGRGVVAGDLADRDCDTPEADPGGVLLGGCRTTVGGRARFYDGWGA